jgi:hypothetical protein
MAAVNNLVVRSVIFSSGYARKVDLGAKNVIIGLPCSKPSAPQPKMMP